jgi:hypothetical protein
LNDTSRSIRGHTVFGSAGRNTRILELQVARIEQLLDELEGLASTSKDFSPAILEHTRAAMEGARRIQQQCSRSERPADLENDIDSDPQPDIDGGMLERMYRELDSDP